MKNALRQRNIVEHAVLLTELLGPTAKRLIAAHIERKLPDDGSDLAFWAALYRSVKRVETRSDLTTGEGRYPAWPADILVERRAG